MGALDWKLISCTYFKQKTTVLRNGICSKVIAILRRIKFLFNWLLHILYKNRNYNIAYTKFLFNLVLQFRNLAHPIPVPGFETNASFCLSKYPKIVATNNMSNLFTKNAKELYRSKWLFSNMLSYYINCTMKDTPIG